jgi:hypothetical protein
MPGCATIVITVCDPGVGPYKQDVRVGGATLLFVVTLSGSAATIGVALRAGAAAGAVVDVTAAVLKTAAAGVVFACGVTAKAAALAGFAVPLDSQESSTICVDGSRAFSGLLHRLVLQHSTLRTPLALDAAATDKQPALAAAI